MNTLNQKWHKYEEGSYPPDDVDVIAYNKKWVHPNWNPKGIRIGFKEEDRFYSAQWSGDSDYTTYCYTEDSDYSDYYNHSEKPEYWTEIPELNL